MDLLAFARGPALYWSVIVFVVGIAWRLTGIFLLKHKKDFSEPRETGLKPWLGGLRLVAMRSWPRHEFAKKTMFNEIMGYVFHIGLGIVVFLFVPHILFMKDVFGVSWPGLPNAFIYGVGVVTIATLLAVLVRRVTHPVLRLISNFDDYFSWFVTIAPLITGFLAVAHFGARYENLLAVHILSVELLLLWFPFGKLMHAFLIVPSRAAEGYAFTRKGAST